MSRVEPTNIQIELDPKRYIVSKTDTKGIITYGNDYFIEVAGYSKEELIGQPHNIIRHPDMPRIAFKLMWKRINNGENMMAIVKNLAKDGRHYWVVTDFEPKFDPITKEIISHTAFRKAAPKKAIEIIEPIYKKLVELEKEGGMKASGEFLENFFKEKKTTYDDFINETVENRGFFKLFFKAMKKIFS